MLHEDIRLFYRLIQEFSSLTPRVSRVSSTKQLLSQQVNYSDLSDSVTGRFVADWSRIPIDPTEPHVIKTGPQIAGTKRPESSVCRIEM